MEKLIVDAIMEYHVCPSCHASCYETTFLDLVCTWEVGEREASIPDGPHNLARQLWHKKCFVASMQEREGTGK